MPRYVLAVVVGAVCLSACGGGNGSPTNPSPSTTRVIALVGDLSFGDVQVGESAERTITIRNTGNSTLTISGMTAPGGFASSWTNGQILAGAAQDVRLRFSPTEAKSYNGTLTVNGDQTSGQNTLPINARGVREPFSRSGTGNTVFDMPTDVQRVRIVGTFDGNCQNFIIWIGGRLIVNEILGSCSVNTAGRRYEGVHLVSGGVVEVRNSNGISWSITEER